jgi:hypothetical protein
LGAKVVNVDVGKCENMVMVAYVIVVSARLMIYRNPDLLRIMAPLEERKRKFEIHPWRFFWTICYPNAFLLIGIYPAALLSII